MTPRMLILYAMLVLVAFANSVCKEGEMTTLEILKAARELISDEKRWTQGCLARDASGQETRPCNVEAICFCATGAVQKIAWNFGFRAMSDALDLLDKASRMRESYWLRPIAKLNDAGTHTKVLAAFDRAIKKAGAQ